MVDVPVLKKPREKGYVNFRYIVCPRGEKRQYQGLVVAFGFELRPRNSKFSCRFNIKQRTLGLFEKDRHTVFLRLYPPRMEFHFFEIVRNCFFEILRYYFVMKVLVMCNYFMFL